MTLEPYSIRWAIEFLERHSDGDIFPHTPEVSALQNQPDDFIDSLAKEQLTNLQPNPCRRFLIRNESLSFRQATQLHPQDSIILTTLVHQFGEGIENRRLSKEQIFSYRFDPSIEKGLYGSLYPWNNFWTTGAEKSEASPFVLYCDIADFYNQIYHHTVENQLAESRFPNQAIKWIIQLLGSTTQSVSRGIPVGPHPAHLIAECTLIPIDNSLVSSGIDFIRYADDFLVFCKTEFDAERALQIIANTLDKQQRLVTQRHKTRIFEADEFQAYCYKMIEDRPISDEEDQILQIVKKYSNGEPYARVTYNQVSEEDWKAFSEDIVTEIISEYIEEEEVDYIRLRWFFRRLAQVGHSGALSSVIENIDMLEPCLPSICSYISSIQQMSSEQWHQYGEHLLAFLDRESIANNEFARLSILSLFSKNKDLNHFVKLAQRFDSADIHMQRGILLASLANGAADWLRERKESFYAMDPWQQMAFVHCSAMLPKEERRFFLSKQSYKSTFEEHLKRISRDGGP